MLCSVWLFCHPLCLQTWFRLAVLSPGCLHCLLWSVWLPACFVPFSHFVTRLAYMLGFVQLLGHPACLQAWFRSAVSSPGLLTCLVPFSYFVTRLAYLLGSVISSPAWFPFFRGSLGSLFLGTLRALKAANWRSFLTASVTQSWRVTLGVTPLDL